MEKQYRLKEEVKKYFCKILHNQEHCKDEWYKHYDITIDALEEVIQKERLLFGNKNSYLAKLTGSEFSFDDRDICEFALNYLEDEDNLNELAYCYFEYVGNKQYNKENVLDFTDWLKQNEL